MTNYEMLLNHASSEGLMVKELPLQGNNGRIKGNRIAIRQDLATSAEKACVLSEELGHHYTTVGNILSQDDAWNRKQERQARFDGYKRLIALVQLIDAYECGCHNRFEIAEHLNVTEEYLQECIDCYRDKYGIRVAVGEYYVVFIPHLMIYKRI